MSMDWSWEQPGTRIIEARRTLHAMGPYVLVYAFAASGPVSLLLAWSEWMHAQTSRGPFVSAHEHNAFGYLIATPGLIALAILVWKRANRPSHPT